MMDKEKLGVARMTVDAEGAVRAESEELGLALSVRPPAGSRFEFSEPLEGVDVNAHSVAKLKHGSASLFKSDRSWRFYLVVESCECRLLSNKSRKLQAIDTSQRTLGFCQDGDTRKVVIFKEEGRLSPIFEFTLAAPQCLIARGGAAVAAPLVAQALSKLAPAMGTPVVGSRKSFQPVCAPEADLLGLGDDFLHAA